jgi:hypothetical protein
MICTDVDGRYIVLRVVYRRQLVFADSELFSFGLARAPVSLGRSLGCYVMGARRGLICRLENLCLGGYSSLEPELARLEEWVGINV